MFWLFPFIISIILWFVGVGWMFALQWGTALGTFVVCGALLFIAEWLMDIDYAR